MFKSILSHVCEILPKNYLFGSNMKIILFFFFLTNGRHIIYNTNFTFKYTKITCNTNNTYTISITYKYCANIMYNYTNSTHNINNLQY